MENTLTIVSPEEFGLKEKDALELTKGLTIILTERETLKNAYLDVIELEVTPENLPTFKDLRLKIRDNRTKGIEKWHKATKDFFLTGGRFVDSVKNKEVFENERMENSLMEKEKHFENIEKATLKAIHDERVSKLIPFNYEIGNVDFSGMDENMFNAILLGAEKTYNDKIESERLAEEKRLEALRLEAEEKEKQRIELERLRVENEAKEKALEAERAKAEAELAEQKRLAEIEAKKQAEIIANQKAEADKLVAELKAKAEAEEKERVRISNETAQRIALEKKAAKAPDKVKMSKVINDLSLNFPELKDNDSLALSEVINQKFEGFKIWALTQINNL